MEADVPKIVHWFSKYFLIPLIDKAMIETKSLIWPTDVEDMYSFDAYFKLSAEIFRHQKVTMGWEAIEKKFVDDGTAAIFAKYAASGDFSKQSIIESITEDFEEKDEIFTILKLK